MSVMKKKIEIEEVENGYTVTNWVHGEGGEDYMYPKKEEHIAEKVDDVTDLVKKLLKK